ncbi:MAG: O-antigen ligase family protein [Patescibacteria group bacterium]|jgi:O-antigen ligase
MPDFRGIYKNAEENTAWYAAGLFFLLAGLIALQSVYSGLTILSIVIGVCFVILTILRPLWTLAFVAVYLPFEPFVLKFVPDDIYVFARYFSEVLIYLLCAVVVWRAINGKLKIKSTPINLPFVLFLVVAISSAIINFVEPSIAILGLRQIIRFILIFFVVIYLRPDRSFVKKITLALLAVVLFEAGLGIVQAIIGEQLDLLLLPSETRTFGEMVLTSGVAQTWESGTRVFATLGRYDRLGTFLAFFLVIASAILYQMKKGSEIGKKFIWTTFVIGLPALVLTYSRSAWFGFLLGFLFIALWIKKDKKVLVASLSIVAILVGYLAYSGLMVSYLIDTPQQTIVERFYETFSYERWRGEYYGMGRLYWMVQTVTTVVPAAPLFGFGPGQYGGGAVAALNNTHVYEQLGLPFGVYGTDGYIDNNWFSLWGETGTLGLAFYIWMYLALFTYSLMAYRDTKNDPFLRALSLGFAAAMIAVALNAFLATFLEVRTLAFYLWLYGGFIVALSYENRARQ